MSPARHLLWIPAVATFGFLAPYLFSDLLGLPSDLYYLLYFTGAVGLFVLYVRTTGLDLRSWLSRRLLWGVLFGIAGGVVLMQGVLARPVTTQLSGLELLQAVVWRGLVYGSVDGLLLFAFPWIVVWRGLAAEDGGWVRKASSTTLALISVLLITTTYHLGYEDFRSRKIIQPNIGSTIGAVPTLVTANPVASPLSHVFLHVTAVLHAPQTDLFLPPHRE